MIVRTKPGNIVSLLPLRDPTINQRTFGDLCFSVPPLVNFGENLLSKRVILNGIMATVGENEGPAPILNSSEDSELNRELPPSKKRLPSGSPEHENDDESRSGHKKFLKDDVETDDTQVRMETEIIPDESSSAKQGISGDPSKVGTDTLLPKAKPCSVDFEKLYEHCKSEHSLLAQLNKMSDLLRQDPNVGNVQTREKPLVITPLIRTLFKSPDRTNPDLHNPLGNDSMVGNVTGCNSSEENAQYYPIENNLFLRAIASSIDGMQITLKANNESVNSLASRVSYMESSNERNLQDLSDRLMENENTSIQNKGAIGEIYSYVDDKITVLKEAIPDTLAEVNKDLEDRLGKQESRLEKLRLDTENLPTKEYLTQKFEKVFNEKILNLESTSMGRISNLEKRTEEVVKMNKAESEFTRKEILELKEKCAKLEAQLSDQAMSLNEKLGSNEKLLEKLKKNPFVEVSGSDCISRGEWLKQKARADDFENRLVGIEGDLMNCKKTTSTLSIQMRKDNVIIDQFSEIDGENVKDRLNLILDLTLSQADRKEVFITKAFRLGNKRSEGPPRKILVELKSGRETVLDKARIITKSGNDGKPYYINDDVPEAVKRRRNDIHKYVLFLREKGQTAEKAGEDVIINGQRWKYGDLNNLPIGLRLVDSRTIFHNGVVAFQLAISPLSNLYHCNLRINGMVFKSAEQSYQYAKCMHHNMPQKAYDIRREPDSHSNMAQGKGITEDADWRECKFRIMEGILRHKAEQVPEFKQWLTETGSQACGEQLVPDLGLSLRFQSSKPMGRHLPWSQ